ncbi:MAG: hypothetical protein FWD17_16705, partial [Polyangiaceae bacterium]|nr:hypothetical protein [Polyangiaceae bacterium]
RVVAKIDARGPAGLLASEGFSRHTGASTFSVTLSPDERTLYAANAESNSVAVIPLSGPGAYRVAGLIPTAYEPHDVTFSADGSWLYIVNGKSVTGPNPGYIVGSAQNQYQFQLEKASLVSAPVPAPWELERLTGIVAQNNFYGPESLEDRRIGQFLHEHVKHVIYIIKENRTFDQLLGDLNNGSNGDPSLVQYGESITPNFHNIARQFVTLDNYNDPGDGSMDGWSWSLQARVTQTETLNQQLNYAAVNRGVSYDSEGTNRNVPVNLPTVAERDAAYGVAGTTNYSADTANVLGGTLNVLAGNGDHSSSDAPFGEQLGYVYDTVLAAGLTVRNYGPLSDNIGAIGTDAAPVNDPFNQGVIQVAPVHASIVPHTDVYFRNFDQAYPDLWRYTEWKREFDQYVANKNLPSLEVVRFSHDHMGSFSSALAGVNTPETQQADDDYTVGLLLQTLGQSPYGKDTVVIVVEDDSQAGSDHVDSHRGTAYIAGAYVRKNAIVSTHYSHVSAIRTIEEILGTPHINLLTAFERPMTDAFDITSSPDWGYSAAASTVLQSTTLFQETPSVTPVYAKGAVVKPKHDAVYWANATKGFDFSDADRVNPQAFNRVLWKGMMGDKPYPTLKGLPGTKSAKSDR